MPHPCIVACILPDAHACQIYVLAPRTERKKVLDKEFLDWPSLNIRTATLAHLDSNEPTDAQTNCLTSGSKAMTEHTAETSGCYL